MGNCCGPVKNPNPVVKKDNTDEIDMIDQDKIIEFLSQAKKAVCEIQKPFGRIFSGFFCKIPYTENKNILLPALITSNLAISKDSITSENIEIIVNGEPKTISLKKRKKWTDKILNFTCIEIKENEDNIHTFFYLDDKVLDNNFSNKYYLGKKVLIYAINENNKQIEYTKGIMTICGLPSFVTTSHEYPNFYQGGLGGCIANPANNSVIGLYNGGFKERSYFTVIFFDEIIKYIKDNKEISSNVS